MKWILVGCLVSWFQLAHATDRAWSGWRVAVTPAVSAVEQITWRQKLILKGIHQRKQGDAE